MTERRPGSRVNSEGELAGQIIIHKIVGCVLADIQLTT
jgi:hypothetical protein